MTTNKDIIMIESDSNPGQYYSVNTYVLTCTCPIFTRKLKSLDKNDPHRLCKHLVQAISKIGIPDYLSQYKDDIKWFAEKKASFTNKISVEKSKKLAISIGSIQTISINKKRKFGYLEGVVMDKKISAIVPLEGGNITYTINNFHAHYDTLTQDSFIPITYRNMEQVIIFWLVDEYNKMRKESAVLAVPKEVNYVPIEKEFPVDSVSTISIEKQKGLVEFWGLVDFDEGEYFHLKGVAGRESIEALIRKNYGVILYNINGSKVYSLDMAPSTDQSTIDLEEIGELTITISSDLSDKFPKNYWFIQKAVYKWLRDNYASINNS
jgi:hypothetical protein